LLPLVSASVSTTPSIKRPESVMIQLASTMPVGFSRCVTNWLAIVRAAGLPIPTAGLGAVGDCMS
jgi:hypothetical protein